MEALINKKATSKIVAEAVKFTSSLKESFRFQTPFPYESANPGWMTFNNCWWLVWVKFEPFTTLQDIVSFGNWNANFELGFWIRTKIANAKFYITVKRDLRGTENNEFDYELPAGVDINKPILIAAKNRTTGGAFEIYINGLLPASTVQISAFSMNVVNMVNAPILSIGASLGNNSRWLDGIVYEVMTCFSLTQEMAKKLYNQGKGADFRIFTNYGRLRTWTDHQNGQLGGVGFHFRLSSDRFNSANRWFTSLWNTANSPRHYAIPYVEYYKNAVLAAAGSMPDFRNFPSRGLTLTFPVKAFSDVSVNPLQNRTFRNSNLSLFGSNVAQTVTLDYGNGLAPVSYTGTAPPVTTYRSHSNNNYPNTTSIYQAQLTFSNPEAITILNLQDSRIQSLPLELRMLRNLGSLLILGQELVNFPDQVLDLPKLTNFDLRDPVTIPAAISQLQSLQALTIGVHWTNSTYQTLQTLPDVLKNMPNLRTLRLGTDGQTMGRNYGAGIPVAIQNAIQLTRLEIWASWAFSSLTGIEKLVNLANLIMNTNDGRINISSGNLPAGWQNLTKLKNISKTNIFNGTGAATRLDTMITDYYNLVTAQASMTAGGNSNIWRSVTFNIGASGIGGSTNPRASGTYQAPAGFVLGSSNGTPASPQEMLYVLANQYSWVITRIV